MKGKKYLFLAGAFFAIIGLVKVVQVIVSILGAGLVGAVVGGIFGGLIAGLIAGLASGVLFFAGIVSILVTTFYLIVGVTGIRHSSSKKKAGTCLTIGIVLTVVSVINLIGDFSIGWLIHLAAGLAYAYGAYLNKA